MSLTRRAALMALPLGLGGCSLFDSWFGESKTPLQGKREPVIAVRRGLEIDPADRRTVAVPAPSAVPEWPMTGGNATHVLGNVATAGLQPAWHSGIGEGGGYRAKLTAQPVIAGGAAYTMDSDGQVSAFDLATGGRQWRTDTQGEKDRSTNVGGGLAVAGNMVYATTGRGEALGLEAATGRIAWRKGFDSPARSGPTLANGHLHFTTLDDRLLALNAADGERVWSYQATTAATTVLTGAAPAVSEGFVITGFGSGELAAVRADSGALAWSDSLASSRGRSSQLDLSAIRALPVIDRGRVFAIGIGGLLVSLDLRSGRRLWERDTGGSETPWLAGDWMFVQTADQSLAAISNDDGRVRWVQDLPRWENSERRRDPIFWSGPVLAGGKLVLAGTSELAVSLDPVSGQILGTQSIRGPAAVSPVVAAGTLLILSDDGTLQAFR
ncbi:MAG: PQQ-binding-like beta-propeller repeat protein [Acetobacteraceae bacterium]|nr:PQQ-binding-like beta-propeller repeat protein [Acetobacteraceae bacterium]